MEPEGIFEAIVKWEERKRKINEDGLEALVTEWYVRRMDMSQKGPGDEEARELFAQATSRLLVRAENLFMRQSLKESAENRKKDQEGILRELRKANNLLIKMCEFGRKCGSGDGDWFVEGWLVEKIKAHVEGLPRMGPFIVPHQMGKGDYEIDFSAPKEG